MSGSVGRIYALVLRHIHIWRSSVMRLVDSIYWPAVQMVMWGFMTQYLMPQASFVAQAAGVLLSGLMLWEVVVRGNLSLSIAFLEEMWSRNLGHLFVSPIRPWEMATGIVIVALLRTLLGLIPVSLMAWAFFGYSIYTLGLPLIAALFFGLGYLLQRGLIQPFIARPEHQQFLLLLAVGMLLYSTVGATLRAPGMAGEAVDDAGFADRLVTDFGFLTEGRLDAHMARADILVFPYRHIDSSGAFLSALHHGKPMVTSDAGMFGQLPDGVAVRAPAGNAPALAQALLPLIESAAIRRDQGARARAYGEDMGSWRDMAARTIGIYEALLAARA